MDFTYQIEQKVTVVELERPGVIRSIYIDGKGIQYNVRYFYNGEAKETYFYRDELKARA